MTWKFTLTIGPPMEDFYIGSASAKLFLPIFKINFPEIVDIALRRNFWHRSAMLSRRPVRQQC